jgi:tetratricopeptide (TPR) repeat protein
VVGSTVYLHSTNESASSALEDPINQSESSMKEVNAREKDLLLLEKILQENLRLVVYEGEVFGVKCAVKNDHLMILTQHSKNFIADTESVFNALELALQYFATPQEQQVELFLRIAGLKLPYAKRSVLLKVGQRGIDQEDQEDKEDEGDSLSSPSSYLPLLPPELDSNDEAFNPMADARDRSFSSESKPRASTKPMLLGAGLSIAFLGSLAYLLTRPCVMSECKELERAQHLEKSLGQKYEAQLANTAKPEAKLTEIEQQIDAAKTSLKTIPSWSLRHQDAEQVLGNLSRKSEKINLAIKAFDSGSQAAEQSQTPTASQQELQARQKLWRIAIAPLETISPKDELYKLTQPKLLMYRARLQMVNQQLVAEDKWLKKLTAASSVAQDAIKRQATAQTIAELDKAQSTWLVVINALSPIPQTSSAYPEAQKLLSEYKPSFIAVRDRKTKEQIAIDTYNQAVRLALQAKMYAQKNQWQVAATFWEQAVNTAKQVPGDSFYNSQAQTLIEPYSAALHLAQEKQVVAKNQQKISTDLDKTCSSVIRVCNFTLEDRGITVKITPEYEQTLEINLRNGNSQGHEKAVANITNHLQTLQQALEVISENAYLPLFVYDAQGRLIHSRAPQG